LFVAYRFKQRTLQIFAKLNLVEALAEISKRDFSNLSVLYTYTAGSRSAALCGGRRSLWRRWYSAHCRSSPRTHGQGQSPFHAILLSMSLLCGMSVINLFCSLKFSMQQRRRINSALMQRLEISLRQRCKI